MGGVLVETILLPTLHPLDKATLTFEGADYSVSFFGNNLHIHIIKTEITDTQNIIPINLKIKPSKIPIPRLYNIKLIIT